MDTQGTAPGAAAAPATWPADAGTALALNGAGTFDWDLDRGLLHVDAAGLAVLDLRPDEYDGRPSGLGARLPAPESARLEALLARAAGDGRERYGLYFRIRCRDGSLRWTHTQGRVRRDGDGRPRRVIGIVRDATDELSHTTDRMTPDSERHRESRIVEETTAALARARTVGDVVDVLESARGMGRLGAVSLMMGFVEGGHIRQMAEGRTASLVPELEYTHIDADFPMSEVVRTMSSRFFVSQREFAVRYPRLWPYIAPLNPSAAAYLPLIAEGRAIGAVGLLFREKHDFPPGEQSLLTALTSTIAQSLQRAMLYEQELELAESLQRFMLPHTIPAIPGLRTEVSYRPARQGRDIGGDWYDVIPLPGGRIAAVIGDVQGHDTHAAAVMGQLRIVLRAYAAEGHTAPTVLSRASAFLHDLDTDRFATCLYAEADPATGWLRLVRAGHLDPLLLEPDGTCRALPVAGALPLGLPDGGRQDFPVTSVELAVGQTLLMFTDGLVERPGADPDEGVDALMAAVGRGPRDLGRLARWLSELPGERAGADDLALVLLRREKALGPRLGHQVRREIAAGDLAAVAAVRGLARSAVRAWNADGCADGVELSVQEMTVNALRHTDGGATVTLRLLDGAERRVRVEVADTSAEAPELSADEDIGLTGRGLLLVDRLADVWGVDTHAAGKTVWCEFVCPGAAPDP
ncbi:SpoIIE family protein phosphatase [Streptomyces sp. TRM 70351]|uniref:SpoIIE family protein phosphatase n=1 Tax=Streptomyces sp. TRM 70351 TaxID=3116552 RepID=UPI002E7AE35B|nr:SpoIIE family protein phosphatase [Streptomyces sp. TRM 70351]MEE1926840.1 SpoIIE family protein phosphatase [Streptomyces sp. TRM 70351]